MLLRWWRERKAPYEHWCLIQLRPDGTWDYLADVGQGQLRNGKRWFAKPVIKLGTSWQRVSHSKNEYQHLHTALRAAEQLVLGNKVCRRIKRATWPAKHIRGWDYPPRVVRGRQLQRARG